MTPDPSTEARLWAKVEKTDSCWLWRGALDTEGYGQMSVASRKRMAHRLAYEAAVGPIPEGLTLDHLCRNHACVNPAHLEPVTNGENILRGTSPSAVHARKTHCIRGHEFTPENTYRVPSDPSKRYCRICRAEGARRRAALAASSAGETPDE